MLHILRQNHSDSAAINMSSLLLCDTLPSLIDLDITANYVEQMPHQIQGSVEPKALQCHEYLLHYGSTSACV